MSDQDYNVKELQNGPISNRSCTDLPCCCIFILAQIGFLLIAVQAFTKGDPNILS